MTVVADVKAEGARRLRERARGHVLLDANADMPVRPEVIDVYLDAAERLADPAEARSLRDVASKTIADILGCEPAALYFTSGGTEADAVALHTLHDGGKRPLMVSAIEHAAVAKTAAAWSGTSLTRMAVGRNGVIEHSTIPKGAGVSVVAASNETGAIQPIDAIADAVHRVWGLLHTDAAQLPGRAPCNVAQLGADLVTFSSHKIGAPAGLGLVVARIPVTRPTSPPPENVAAIVAFAKALTLLPDPKARMAMATSRDALESALRSRLPGTFVVAEGSQRLANTSCIGFTGCDGDAVMMALDVRGIAVSTGSACSSGSIEPSPILLGMGLSPREAKSTIRISLPKALTRDELMNVADTIALVVNAARAMPA